MGDAFIANFGTARSKGGDIAISGRLMDRLTLGGSIAYTDARLTSDVFGPADATGLRAVYGRQGDALGVRPWSGTLFGDYTLPLAGDLKGYGRVDYQHISGAPTPDYSVYGVDSAIAPAAAYNSVALRIGVRKLGVDLSLFVDNLLNDAPILTRNRDTNDASNQLFFESTLRPRTYGITGTYRY